MFQPVHSIAVLIALSACWVPAPAQDVYRCGQSYGNIACPGGIVVVTADPRSTAQRAQTDAATRRDTKLAQLLEKDRLRQEANAAPTIILVPVPVSGPASPVAPTVNTRYSRHKVKKPEFFTAVVPKTPGAAAPKTRKKKTATA